MALSELHKLVCSGRDGQAECVFFCQKITSAIIYQWLCDLACRSSIQVGWPSMMGNVQQGMLAEDTLRFSNAWTVARIPS
jgi:hypothetical protein